MRVWVSKDEELKGEIYAKLKSLGVNIEAVKQLDLSLSQLQEFYQKIRDLVGIDPNWYKSEN
jgi:nucleoside diphosphate kinase